MKFSSWTYFHGVIVWINHFIINSRLPEERHVTEPLFVVELSHTEMLAVKHAGMELFPEDWEASLKKLPQVPRSKLLSLTSFVGKARLLHVGGPLCKAPLPEKLVTLLSSMQCTMSHFLLSCTIICNRSVLVMSKCCTFWGSIICSSKVFM